MSLRFVHHFLFTLLLLLAANPVSSFKEWFHNSKQFYREVRIEMKQVNWPDRHEVAGTTVIVLIVGLILGIYLSTVDELSRRTVGWIMRYFGATP
jgi:preprotein translocase subunit SecE